MAHIPKFFGDRGGGWSPKIIRSRKKIFGNGVRFAPPPKNEGLATPLLTMCFDEQITQGKVHFTMPNIIFRTRAMSCELPPLLCRPLLNVSLTRHTKEKCRIDQQYIFHWWSVKIFNCLSFRRQFKKN